LPRIVVHNGRCFITLREALSIRRKVVALEYAKGMASAAEECRKFQAQFHWHVENKGSRHSDIKPRTRRPNGKVGRSHRSDQEEFYQLLTYADEVDLRRALAEWEQVHNLSQPSGAIAGWAPYEAARRPLS
jgi:transposase InsO family protein